MLIKLILVKPEKKYISKKENNALWVRHTNADVWGKSARRLTTAWDSMCVSICLWKKTKSALHQWQQESLLFDSSPSRYWFSDGSERIWEKDHGGSYYYTHHMYTLTLYSFIYIYFFSSVFFFLHETWVNIHNMDRIHARNLVQELFQLAAVKSQGFFHNLWRTAGSCSHVYCSCWITSLCFTEQEIPHLTKVHWITPW